MGCTRVTGGAKAKIIMIPPRITTIPLLVDEGDESIVAHSLSARQAPRKYSSAGRPAALPPARPPRRSARSARRAAALLVAPWMV